MAPQDERIKNLYEGKLDFISVEFPADPAWDTDKTYTDQCKQYHSMFRNKMPMVPAVFTHCELYERDEPDNENAVRVGYRAMVLEPIKWVLDYQPTGNPINAGEDKGQYKIEHEETETIKFHASVEFSSEVGAEGSRGPVQASASLKTSAGASWEKSVSVTYKRTIETEQGCNYQPTRFYAKLHCKVVRSKSADFLAHGMGEELVTTNPFCSPVEAKHKCSGSYHGLIKSIKELSRLHDACGKDVVFGRHGGGRLWARASVARLKIVVDPEDSTLYVTGAAFTANTNGFMSTQESIILLNQLKGVANSGGDDAGRLALGIVLPSVSTPPIPQGKLTDYRGLWGRVGDKDKTEDITYSPGDLVKIWNVIVKAKA